ncbi:mas-related G-protein coupled receptor member H-like [Varanus komodoensis]|uniref:mas-related G-protein coupled receptor member H-like n=1 Tax=Varanus komodoensis TaxID=61221 RepID=UPI001CF76936|nr:mas-related G-protein coupled receptor member H-like [Varanus komodoensis]XP_044308774.1 mas-related G-protein coupled receptor member H-like [Varanus komodoensis]
MTTSSNLSSLLLTSSTEGKDTVHKCSLGPAFIIFDVLMFIICLLGLVGNGIVTRLLGFHIKRNAFTTYILNLTVADFGVLLAIFPIPAYNIVIIFSGDSSLYRCSFVSSVVLKYLFPSMYCTGQLLLTAISMDRCVSVLFPIWYRFRCPSHFSTTICVLIWVLCFLLCEVNFILYILPQAKPHISLFLFLVIALLCLPLMAVSSIILFFRACFKSQQERQGKLLTVILLVLVFFLIFAFPLPVIDTIMTLFNIQISSPIKMTDFILLNACLNSSVKPLIYYLVGRHRRGQSRESMKVILQKVFNGVEDTVEQLELRVQTQV